MAWETEGGTAVENMRIFEAAVLHAIRTNCEIMGEENLTSDDSILNENDAAAWIFSRSMDPRQSSRIEFKREHNNLKEGVTVTKQDSDRNSVAKWSQNCQRAR